MSEESVTTSSTTYITADGRKVRKVKKKKVTIEESSLNGSRRESEVEISEISSTLNSDSTSSQNVDSNVPAITEGNTESKKVKLVTLSKHGDFNFNLFLSVNCIPVHCAVYTLDHHVDVC